MSALAQTPTNISLNLEKGKLYTIKSTSHQKIQQTFSGQQMNIDVQSNRFISYRMVDKTNDIMTIEVKFDTIASVINAPMMKRETNSAKPGKEPIDKLLNRLSATKIQAKISTAGKFIGFVDYNSFRNNILILLDSIPASKRDDAKKQAEALVKESAVKSMIEPFFTYLPEKAVKDGDKWENSYMSTANDVATIVQNAYTLNKIEGNKASISGTSQLESMPSTDPNAKTIQEFKGTSTAEGDIDIATGLIIKMTEKSHIDGSVTVKNDGNDMKIPMVIDSQSETFMTR